MAKKIKPELIKAWAIDTCCGENPGLVGRFYFGDDVPIQFGGYRVACFNTRKIARENLYKPKGVKGSFRPFPKAKVVQVEVLITPTKKGRKK